MRFVAVQNKTWFNSRGGRFLTATGAPVASQDCAGCVISSGVEINVRATFELLPVRRPILSVSRLVEKRVCC